MKKTLKIKLVINLILLFCFSSSLISQWAITPKNGGQGDGSYHILEVDEFCQYQACYNVYIYSPEQHPFIADAPGVDGGKNDDGFDNRRNENNSTDPGGNGLPPMYLRIKFANVDEVYPLTNWTLYDDAVYIESHTPVEGLYRSTICIDFDLTNPCLFSFSTEDDPLPETPTMPFLRQLLTSDGNGGYIEYPICLFRYPGSYFSCEIFLNNYPYCVDPSFQCINEEQYQASGEIPISCEQCNYFGFGTSGGNGNFSSNQKNFGKTRSSESSTIGISPNPFTDYIQIENLDQGTFSTIRIYDNSGTKVKSMRSKQSRLNISTSDLHSGLYYIIIETGEKVETFKILKI